MANLSFNRRATAAVHARATLRSMVLRAGMAVRLRAPVNSTLGMRILPPGQTPIL
jgi:hypothetical protein